MKKYLLSAALLLLPLFGSAEIVSRQRAAEYAALRFGCQPEFVWDGTSSSAETPSFYVFNSPRGGWVIISAEDAGEPLIGYSNSGAFKVEGMPVNMKSWLDSRRLEVKEIRKSGFKQNPAMRERWENFALRTKGATEVLLKTAEWDQVSPYNAKCFFDNKYSYVGCVATAMAIVLHYHKWPEQGKGTIGSYTTRTNGYSIPSSTIDDHIYYWELMPTDTRGMNSAPEVLRDNVCQLMYDCATMVQMDFTPNGSGAYSSDVRAALVGHMSYDASATYIERAAVQSDSEWLMIIKEEIDNNRPILYSAVDVNGNGGHEFVLDGYDSNMNVHFNWGWSGENNGYFNINNLNPSIFAFNKYHDMLYSLIPVGGKPSEKKASIALYGTGSAGSLQVASGEVRKGEEFKIKKFKILNTGADSYDGKVKAVIIDRNGEIKETIGEEIEIKLASFRYGALTEDYPCKFESDIKYGDVISLVFSDKENWKIVGTYDDTGKSSVKKEIPVCEQAFIRPPKSTNVGEMFYFELIASKREVSSVKFLYDGLEVNAGAFVILKEGAHIVDAEITYADGKAETVRRTFTSSVQP